MSSASLFPSVLGSAFARLEPQLQWIHGGEGRELSGTVTVQRGHSIVARVLGAVTSLPPALVNASILVRIEVTGDTERWIRTYAGGHRMSSMLSRDSSFLVERLGPAALTFRVSAHNGGMDWHLEKVSLLRIPLPARWFEVSARVDMQQARYHFLIDSALRGVGRIVRYEGLLDDGR